jgi:hypothetical protein
VKDDQVEGGINQALTRVEADGVIVEGNSFLEYVGADVTIMCARSAGGKVKASARRALAKSDFLYLSSLDATAAEAKRQFEQFCAEMSLPLDLSALPIITRETIRMLLLRIYQLPNTVRRIVRVPSIANVHNQKPFEELGGRR